MNIPEQIDNFIANAGMPSDTFEAQVIALLQREHAEAVRLWQKYERLQQIHAGYAVITEQLRIHRHRAEVATQLLDLYRTMSHVVKV